MREIKLRVWEEDYLGKYKMNYAPYLTEVDGAPHGYTGLVDLNEGIRIEQGAGNVFMRYTGLKDRNGKEIYEDDILRSVRGDGSEYLVKIVFEDGCFLAQDLMLKFKKTKFDSLRENTIIGNVHMNPELETIDEY